jgi:hypothetical protein
MRGGMVCDGICAEGWHDMGYARRHGMIWDMCGGMVCDGMPRTPSSSIEVPWPSVP